jgi:hypothetical protein
VICLLIQPRSGPRLVFYGTYGYTGLVWFTNCLLLSSPFEFPEDTLHSSSFASP